MDFLYKDVAGLDAAAFKARIDEAELKLDGFPRFPFQQPRFPAPILALWRWNA
jgi:hypothetical protein